MNEKKRIIIAGAAKTIGLIVVILAITMSIAMYCDIDPFGHKCFSAGDQWGKQNINFFHDPNGELEKVTYTIYVEPNSPDWGTWQRRFLEFQQEKTINW